MKVGYARVSKEDQKLDLQLDALQKAGCEIIFQDHGVSGAKISRPELDKCLASLKAGDSLIVWKFDRLGRTAFHLTRLIQELTEKDIFFVSITQSFDTSTPSGKFMSTVMAGAAEYERDVLIERINAGIKAAQDRGTHCGRTNTLSPEQRDLLQTLHQQGTPTPELAKRFAVSLSTAYRTLRENKS